MKLRHLAIPLMVFVSSCTPELSTPPESPAVSQKLDLSPRQTFPCWNAFSIPIPAEEYEVAKHDGGDFWTFTVSRKASDGYMLIYNGHNPHRARDEGEEYVADIAGERIKGRKLRSVDEPKKYSLEFYRPGGEKEDVYHIVIRGSDENKALFLGMLSRMQLHPDIPAPPPPALPEQ